MLLFTHRIQLFRIMFIEAKRINSLTQENSFIGNIMLFNGFRLLELEVHSAQKINSKNVLSSLGQL